MSAIEESGDSGHKKGPGVKKAKKLSTRVDMTPMVDLGFLLITFFIFTTTMQTPSTMKLNMPKDTKKPEEQNKAKASGALTIMLGKDNHVFYYEGELKGDASNFKSSNFKEIRDIIINKRKDVISRYVRDPDCEAKAQKAGKNISDCAEQDFVVIIKPNNEATFKNTVDILDEMTINGVKRYAMIDITPTEVELIRRTEGGAAQK